METIFAFTELAHRPIDRSRFEVVELTRGGATLAEALQFEAVPTDHFSNENRDFPSWALRFGIGGKRVLFTGDLARDLHDFPRGNACDLAFCELTHFKLSDALETLKQEKFGRLVFTHIGNEWHGAAAEARFREQVRSLPYPAEIAHDGEEFEL